MCLWWCGSHSSRGLDASSSQRTGGPDRCDKRASDHGNAKKDAAAKDKDGAGKEKLQGTDATPADAASAFTDEQWQKAIERVVEHHRASGGTFTSESSRSGYITVHARDVENIKKASVESEEVLGIELSILLGAVLTEN